MDGTTSTNGTTGMDDTTGMDGTKSMDCSTVHTNPKVIVLRGPAGAGKSTVASLLISHLRMTECSSTFVMLEQDYFNNVVTGRQKGYRDLTINLLLQSVLVCSNSKCNVIIEGVLNIEYFKPLFDCAIAAYGLENVLFYYFDISLEETKRRHMTRQKAHEFSIDLLDEWYPCATPSGYAQEVVISATMSAEQAVNAIASDYKCGGCKR